MGQSRAYAEALRTLVEAQTFSKDFVIGDMYDFDLAGGEVGSLDENTVYVAPITRNSVRSMRRPSATKDAWIDEVQLSVYVAGPCQQNTTQEVNGNEEVGSWIDFVEEIADYCRNEPLTIGSDVKRPIELTQDTLYDLERLRSERQFRSMFTLTYRGV
jgi:hypothetical protein